MPVFPWGDAVKSFAVAVAAACAAITLAFVTAFAFGACGASAENTATPSGTAPAAPAAPAAPELPQPSLPALAPDAPARPTILAPRTAPTPAARVTVSRPDGPAPDVSVARLVISMTAPTVENNSPLSLGGSQGWPLGPMYEWTAYVDPETGSYVPMLAEDWTISDDSIAFRFRKGVQFHNGWGELNAYDFEEAINNALHEESTGRSLYSRTIDRVEVHNDWEATVFLSRVNATLFRNFSQFLPGFEMMSSANRQDAGYPTLDDTPLAGTGPYQFESRSEGSYIRFQRVPYQHWRTTPDFLELELRFINEESTRLAALLTEEIHITPLATDLHDQAFGRGMKSVQGTIPAKRTFLQYLCCFLTDPLKPELGYVEPDAPLMDVRVRRALSKAIDRDVLNRALFSSTASTMFVQGYNSTSQGWDPEWEARYPEIFGYDPDAARQLLFEAGYGPDNPYEMSMILFSSYRGLPEGQDMALAIVDMIKDIGVRVNIESMGASAVNQRMRSLEFTNHLRLAQTSADLFTNVFVYANQVNRTPNGFIHPRLNELSAAVRSTTDPEEHSRHFREIGDLMVEHNQNIPLLWIPNIMIYNPDVVSGWRYPGSLIAAYSHFAYVEAATRGEGS